MNEIILEDSKFLWTKDELRRFREYWEEGLHYQRIAKRLRVKDSDVILLAIDQTERKKIEDRKGGIYGNV